MEMYYIYTIKLYLVIKIENMTDISRKCYIEGGILSPEKQMIHVIPYMLILLMNF